MWTSLNRYPCPCTLAALLLLTHTTPAPMLQAMTLIKGLNLSPERARTMFLEAINSTGREFVDETQFIQLLSTLDINPGLDGNTPTAAAAAKTPGAAAGAGAGAGAGGEGEREGGDGDGTTTETLEDGTVVVTRQLKEGEQAPPKPVDKPAVLNIGNAMKAQMAAMCVFLNRAGSVSALASLTCPWPLLCKQQVLQRQLLAAPRLARRQRCRI